MYACLRTLPLDFSGAHDAPKNGLPPSAWRCPQDSTSESDSSGSSGSSGSSDSSGPEVSSGSTRAMQRACRLQGHGFPCGHPPVPLGLPLGIPAWSTGNFPRTSGLRTPIGRASPSIREDCGVGGGGIIQHKLGPCERPDAPPEELEHMVDHEMPGVPAPNAGK